MQESPDPLFTANNFQANNLSKNTLSRNFTFFKVNQIEFLSLSSPKLLLGP